MTIDTENSVSYRRILTSNKLFIAFTGNAHRLMMHPLLFLRHSGIASHNILIFRDPSRRGYQCGISDAVSSIESLARYIAARLSTDFRHVQELYTIGTSAGGYPALYCGYALGARAIWCFGARICRIDAVTRRDLQTDALLAEVFGPEAVNDIRRGLIDANLQMRLHNFAASIAGRARLTQITEDTDSIIDVDLATRSLLLFQASPFTPIVHFYYSLSNPIDSWVANRFSILPSSKLHGLAKEPDETIDFLGRSTSHNVVGILDKHALLKNIFEPFV